MQGILFSFILRRSNHDEIEDEDYDIRLYKNISKDEEWLHNNFVSIKMGYLILKKLLLFFSLFQTNIYSPFKTQAFSPLDASKVEELKERRLEEIKMQKTFYEILRYFMFLWILYVVAYSNSNSQSFLFQKNMKDMFISSTGLSDFSNVMIIFFIPKIIAS